MTELKTLKKIFEKSKYKEIIERELKAEAIKWVKYWTKQWREEGNYGDDNYDPCSSCFIHFFNLTEEELSK